MTKTHDHNDSHRFGRRPLLLKNKGREIAFEKCSAFLCLAIPEKYITLRQTTILKK